MSGEVRVHYYAAARELAGTPSESVALPSPSLSVRAFMELLGARHSTLAPLLRRMRLAINGELAGNDQLIAAGDEVSVLPPVAGGSSSAEPSAEPPLCALRATPLSVDEVLSALRRPEAGGIALFVGVVRDHAGDKRVVRLDYEAHDTLALRELQAVLHDVGQRHPDARLAVVHRVGQLEIGELAVVVGASAPHRAEAFVACREAIEQLKQRVPIWKKEWSADGSADWVNLSG